MLDDGFELDSAALSAAGLSVGKLTDIGQVRSRNEDAMDLRQGERDDEPSLFLVADGMGGHSAGDVASQMAVESTLASFYESTDGDVSHRLRSAIEGANRKIYEAAQTNADYFRMGTTIVGAAVLGNRADVANVGDSRVYIVRKDGIQQVTRDHSWVALQVEMGELTPEEAQVSQNRSVLLRCLGEKGDVLVDIVELRVRPGDMIVLCTDGLHGQVSPEEIRDAVTSNDPQKACDDLVALANSRGGYDNITVQVVRIDRCSGPSPDELDEGDEIVIQRVYEDDGGDDSNEPPVVGRQMIEQSLGVQHDRINGGGGEGPSDSVPETRPPPRPAARPTPWILIVLMLLAGAMAVALADRVFTRPGDGGPVPVKSTASIEPSARLNASPVSSPGSTVIGRPAARPTIEEGDLCVDRTQRPSSLTVVGDQLYWVEESKLWHAPAGGWKAESLPEKARVTCIGGYDDKLYACLDGTTRDDSVEPQAKEIVLARLEGASTMRRIDKAAILAGPAKLLAASNDSLVWVEAGRQSIQSIPVVQKPPATVDIVQASDDVVGLVMPPGSKKMYWAVEGTGIFTSDMPSDTRQAVGAPLVRASVTTLAANRHAIYWTEDSKDNDGTALLRRCGLDGSKIETIATLRGPVYGLAVTDNRIFWVMALVDGFSVRSLEIP